MKSESSIRALTVVTTHQNADFDALGACVGAAKLYRDAKIVFPGSLNRNVRDFVSLHGESLPIVNIRGVQLSAVRRLVVVDTADSSRLGDLAPLCGCTGVEVVIFDHHSTEAPQKPDYVKAENWVLSDDGSQSSSMVHILRGRDIHLTPLEASIFALGIHEDTGSLVYPQTTVRDAEMLATCLRLGASQALIERYLHNPLADEQREMLLRILDTVRVERIQGHDVFVAAVASEVYVDGLSVIAHKVMDLMNSEVLIQAVGMIGRVFVTARSRLGSIDVAALLHTIGGGGHAQAASGVVRGRTAEQVARDLVSALQGLSTSLPTAGEIMSRPVHFVQAGTTVTDALLVAQKYGHSGIAVEEDGIVAGVATRRDLDKAVRHGLGHAPVKGIMSRRITFAGQSTTVEELRRLMMDAGVGRVPVVSDELATAPPKGGLQSDDVLGIVTKTDLLAAYQTAEHRLGPDQRTYHTCVLHPLEELPFFGPILRAAAALSLEFEGVYLVGGFVRDLLLGLPNADLDIAVEGDGVRFAELLAKELGGRVRVHRKFKTAVVMLPEEMLERAPVWVKQGREPFHVDVATCRTEFYDYPAALPSVEHASIRQDLFRRDFTINAMAVALKGDDYGTVIDFFGGLNDLQAGVVRVLHNLSFIEDPTRIFRAARYENRYRFRMDEQTRALAKGCVDMYLVGDLSTSRLRDELIALLSERDVDWSLERLYELGVAKQVHPKLSTGPRTLALVHRLDGFTVELGVESEVVRWRLRLAAVTRHMEHEELYLWLERLRLRHADSEVIRDSVVLGPKLAPQLENPDLEAWQIFRLLSRLPVESLVFLLARAQSRVLQDRVYEYLRELRFCHPALSGDDIIRMGLKEGPGIGRVLGELQRLRVEGKISGREEEREVARKLIEDMEEGADR
ncbi:MAG: CBS domain-containing protein [Gaiellales bacterium]|nr:CBS domain-containing protein [Gaiellales bacterium]